MLGEKKTTGRTLSKGVIKRKQKRKPRRLIEALPSDWERWDAAAQHEGMNFSEWARRAMDRIAFCGANKLPIPGPP